MNPSTFAVEPWSCVFGDKNHEVIARNIMTILKRTGDQWRELSFAEYSEERAKDGASEFAINGEKKYFDDVIEYTISEQTARLFSPTWKHIK